LRIAPWLLASALLGSASLSNADEGPKAGAPPGLASTGTLRGVVRDPNGSPARNATVYVVRGDRPRLVRYPHDLENVQRDAGGILSTTTLANGSYEISGFECDAAYVAFADADGWARSSHRVGVLASASATVAHADFVLRRRGEILVHVRAADGTAAKAHVEVSSDLGWSSSDTDNAGVLRVSGLDPIPHKIVARSAESLDSAMAVDVVEGRVTEATVRLEDGVSITGVVVDDLGDPVPLTTVAVRHQDEKPTGHFNSTMSFAGPAGDTFTSSRSELTYPEQTGESDQEGRFVVHGLKPGPNLLDAQIFSRGGMLPTPGYGRYGRLEGTVVRAPSKDLRVVLPRSGRAEFHLLVPPGASPPRSLTMYQAEVVPFGGVRFEQTWWHCWCEDGGVDVSGLDPGTWRIRVVTAEFAPVEFEFKISPGVEADLGARTLDPGLRLSGRVEDRRGVPIVGALVATGNPRAVESQRTATAVDGSFRIARLPAGPTSVHAEAPGFLPTTIQVPITPDGVPCAIRLDRGTLLTVTVRDATGAVIPLASVVVRAAESRAEATPEVSGTSDFRGRFEARIPAGEYRVSLDGNDAGVNIEAHEGSDADVSLVKR
jgi:protocatechuate 3,4-dioxygenase beta subunit